MRALVPLAALALLLPGCITTSPPEPLDRGGLVPALPSTASLTSHAALLQRLRALEPLGVRVDALGDSVGGRELDLVQVGHGPFELWLAARHHGNEVTSTDASLNVVDYLLGRARPGEDALPVTRELYEHRALLLERLTVVLVPMVNPDGAEHDQRRNLHGQDLNRDYLLFKEPETRAVRDGFWRVWPDAGLDLHNEGLGDHDYDAYYPEVPRAEPATQELSLRNQWTVVHEVEAGGAYAGGPNENYVTSEISDPCDMLPVGVPVPPPTDHTNPTAYCEGTHDAFLTLRGAPGWTPETGLAYAEGAHAKPESIPWATRLHEATIASTALLYAGFYDGCTPRVQKLAGALARSTTIPVVTQGPARFQLVWREDALGLDQNPAQLDLTLRAPSGTTQGPALRPLGYTQTLRSHEAGSHLATIASHALQPVPYELRVHECAPGAASLEVQRSEEGLRARNTGDAPLEVEVQDSWPGAPAVAAPDAASIARVQGALAPKTIVTWRFALAPGEGAALLERGPPDARPGPFRWHAHGPWGATLLGVAEERAGPAPR